MLGGREGGLTARGRGSQDREQGATDLALAGNGPALQLPLHGFCLELRYDQRQNGHGWPVLAHQTSSVPCSNYITLHYITLHDVTSHDNKSHHITSHHMTLGVCQAAWGMPSYTILHDNISQYIGRCQATLQ